MVRRPRTALIALGLLASSLAAGLGARADAPRPCFDFSKPVVTPLRPPIPYPTGTAIRHFPDAVASGERPQGGSWASARGRLFMPIGRAISLLQDPTTIKDPEDVEIRVRHERRPGFLDFMVLDLTAKPLPFISVDWQENWAFAVAEGTREKPVQVVFSYEKVSGTEHIKRLCGNITLTAVDATTTDASLYEEVEAPRRDPEAVARGHQGTLRTLRERGFRAKSPEPKPSSSPEPEPSASSEPKAKPRSQQPKAR